MFDFSAFCLAYALTLSNIYGVHSGKYAGIEAVCPDKSLYSALISKLRRAKGVQKVERYGDTCFITLDNDPYDYLLTYYKEEEG